MRHISAVRLLTLALVVLLSAPVGAEPPHTGHRPGMMGPAGPMAPPVFLEHVFPPELVMHYQTELGLTPSQQEAMTQIMVETQAKLVELQWKFGAATQELSKIIEQDKVDEAAALAQWTQLSEVEQQIKKTHLSLLLRIKNQLTPNQQEQLRALRPKRRGPPWLRPGPAE